jgi:hypothetical protein
MPCFIATKCKSSYQLQGQLPIRTAYQLKLDREERKRLEIWLQYIQNFMRDVKIDSAYFKSKTAFSKFGKR